jgi:FKBP-type peptidyl-prolyl cis-trans isomerase
MKNMTAVAVLISLLAGASFTQEKPTPKSSNEKISYSIGVNIGKNIKMEGLGLNNDFLFQGIKDALGDSAALMSDREVDSTLYAFQQEMRTKMEAKRLVEVEKNKKAGEAFLAANKLKKGVKTLASGLQYKVITQGKGKKPKATQTVKCNYKGMLIDSTEFDNSYKRGAPAEFPVTGVIKGWTEALQLMPVGSKWELFIPSDLAYGDEGRGQVIPPASTLIFEVELLSIK